MPVTNRGVGWATGALVTLGGTVAVLALGSYSRTLVVRAFVLGAVWLSGVIAGFTASWVNRGAAKSGTWSLAVPSMVIGAVSGVMTFLVLCGIASVVAFIAFEHSGFVW